MGLPGLASLALLLAVSASPGWMERLYPGGRFVVTGVTFEGRGGSLVAADGLSDLAAALREVPGVRVRVEAFVDASDDPGGDTRVSEGMAREVADRLAALGVPRARISWAGRGGESPILPNSSARARETNRRIEVVVLPRTPTGT
jgi:hypothetical protein